VSTLVNGYAATSESQLVCVVPCSVHACSDSFICIRYSDGRVISLDRHHAHVLTHQSGFKSIQERVTLLVQEVITEYDSRHDNLPLAFRHLAKVFRLRDRLGDTRRGHGYRTRAEFKSILNTLIDEGLLVTDSGWSKQIAGLDYDKRSWSQLSSIGIPTCNRPEYLKRCIGSFSKAMSQFGRPEMSIFVVDDSDDPAAELASREAAKVHDKNTRSAICFIGRQERHALLKLMGDSGCAPTSILKFGLAPDKTLTTEGAVRNVLTLLTLGSLTLQTDDDTVAQFAGSKSPQDPPIVSAAPDPCQAFFYESFEKCSEHHPRSDIDPFRLHETMLGKPLHDIIDFSDGRAYSDIDTDSAMALWSTGARVQLTSTGALGDPGMQSNFGFVTLSPLDTIARVYASSEAYMIATQERNVFRAAPSPTVSRASLFQGMSFGLDNTRLVPPFFPLGRNLDGAFASLCCMSDESAWIGYLPVAIVHQPESHRRYTSSFLEKASSLSLTDILQMCLHATVRPRGTSRSIQLRCIGEQLVAFGTMKPTTFRSFILDRFVQMRLCYLMKFLKTKLTKCDFDSSHWGKDLDAIEHSIRSAATVDVAVASELLRFHAADEALEATMRYIYSYGTLLCFWEQMTEAAGTVLPGYFV
jgi:hypothetical protein